MINKVVMFDDNDRARTDGVAVFTSAFITEMKRKLSNWYPEEIDENTSFTIFCASRGRGHQQRIIGQDNEEVANWSTNYWERMNIQKNDNTLILCDFEWSSLDDLSLENIWNQFAANCNAANWKFVVTTRIAPDQAREWLTEHNDDNHMHQHLLQLSWDPMFMCDQIGEFIENEWQY